MLKMYLLQKGKDVHFLPFSNDIILNYVMAKKKNFEMQEKREEEKTEIERIGKEIVEEIYKNLK